MCNRYQAPSLADIVRHWSVSHAGGVADADGSSGGWPDRPSEVFPRSPGPFIRAAGHGPVQGQSGGALAVGAQCVVGQWGLIPDFATRRHLPYSTNNARSEEVMQKPSFQQAWALGQRCIIPAWHFDEPCWETGRNVWWRFHRRDGTPWGLAGLWNRWTEPETGELVESYTMLTLNADAHPLMRRMHKPDPALPPEAQDKRSVVPIERADVATWLHGSAAQGQQLLRLAPVALFDAAPLNPPAQLSLL